ncbi:4,5-dihydroxyphthalate decarboxylase [Blastococcus aggregatus]|uniref:4,5-dihydroxyphthalate decarboxylase n=1 Tax=Blastococcus aggregatus TaxID=38502 RepID=A0A285V677_9ACTN|nr:4,5-dihydroxyphthalate decarboxylase [Blastococcus aggregatus]SOC49513.1 4,5-dihydroxyphthalate decarboxylase [Blastococcus aggregatus]
MGSKVRMTIMVGDYDITRPILDGTVQPQGVDLTVLTAPSPPRHWRMLKHREFDAAELSMGSYVTRRGRGEDDLVAIPVFPHRRFRHGYVFASARSDIRRPSDLSGAAIGIRSWQTTAGVWLRGILGEHHGLALDQVRWVAQDSEDVPLDLPPGVHVDRVPAGRTITEMCVEGELAGLIYPEIPGPIRRNEGTIRRVFHNPKSAEQEYYRTTGIFPIMHTVAIRAELLAAHPWIARNLFDAFQEAKRLAYERMEDPRTVSLAWLRALIEEERALLGRDPWEYGLSDRNRRTLERFLGYAGEQGMVGRDVTVDGLFYPSTLETPPRSV